MTFQKVNPKQSFPEMEEAILAFWREGDTFQKSIYNMKKLVIIGVLLLVCSCTSLEQNELTTIELYNETNPYFKVIQTEEKEFTFDNTLKKHNFLFKKGEELVKNHEIVNSPSCGKLNCEKVGYGVIEKETIIGNNHFQLVRNSFNSKFQKFYIFKNGKLGFEDTLVWIGANSPIDFSSLNDEILVVYTKEGSDGSLEFNTLYGEEHINEKYNFSDVSGFFTYQEKEGFIIDNQKIFYNGKVLDIEFDYIQSKSCCTVPSLFKVYSNGALILANKKENSGNLYYEIIEIDLNDYN